MSTRKRQLLTGQKFGRLTVIGWDMDSKGKTLQVCQCECGSLVKAHTYRIKLGKLISCGCYARDKAKDRMTENAGAYARRYQMSRPLPVKEGDISGALTVIREANPVFSAGNIRRAVLCRCECGVEKIIPVRDIITGNSKSCGCLRKAGSRFSHGHTQGCNSPEYNAWSGAKDRCYNPHNKDYANYGGRGITMADEWKNDFQRFLADMGPRPSQDHSLDRVDVDEGYTPANCIWASKKEQVAHRRKLSLIQKREREEMKVEIAMKNIEQLTRKIAKLSVDYSV